MSHESHAMRRGLPSRRLLGMIIITITALAAPVWAQVPQVTNVSFTQSPDGTTGTKVDIYYDVTSSTGNCPVTAHLSTDNGVTFPYNVATATGDIGVVAPGTGKHIVWNIAADCAPLTTTQAVVRVTAATSVEHITDGAFAATTYWTGWGTQWRLTANTAEKWGNGGTALTQGPGQLAYTPVAGSLYSVAYTMSNRSAGSCTVSLGGTNGTARNANGTYVESITCGAIAPIQVAFAPTGNARFCIDNVSVMGPAGQGTSGAGSLDTVLPSVTINQATGQSDPTSTSPINFTAVFSKAVTNFATGDVTVAGTATGTKVGTVTGGPTTYNMAVTGTTSAGTVIATIAAGVCQDALGNLNAASTSTDNTVNVTTPTVGPVSFTQGPNGTSGTKVDISYDLISPSGNCTVKALLSKDNGATYPFPITTATGDIGTGVTPGSGKSIVWTVASDCPNENIGQARIKIIAILGAPVECVNNGTFTGSLANWTLGGGWAYDTTVDATGAAAKGGPNSTNTLTQTASQQANALFNGTT